MNCSMLTAHMFTFYFGIVADITPPVALAAMAGSAIAKAKPMKTGVNAVKLAIAAFLIPYIFVYNEVMLMINAEWYDLIRISATAIVGMIGIGCALEGYGVRHAHLLQRVMFLVGGLLLIEPGLMTDIIGIGLVVLAALWQMLENKRFGGRMEPAFDHFTNMSFGKKCCLFFTESFTSIGKLFTAK